MKSLFDIIKNFLNITKMDLESLVQSPISKMSLLDQSFKTLIPSLSENCKQLLLDNLIKDLRSDQKQKLYEKLAFDLHGGIKMTGEYTYVIYSVNYTNRLQNNALLTKIYKYMYGGGVSDASQILFVDGCGTEENVKFDCARKGKMEYIPENHVLELHEHYEARDVYNILKTLNSEMLYGSIVAKFNDDGFHNEEGLETTDTVPILSYPIKWFSKGIKALYHCSDLHSSSYDEREFSIEVNGKRCLVLYRHFDTQDE